MLNVGSHAAHVDLHLSHEEQVARQILHGLEWESDHDACPCLVAGFFKCFKCPDATCVAVLSIIRVQLPVKFFVRGLDAEQVALGTALKPAAVCLFGLFAAG